MSSTTAGGGGGGGEARQRRRGKRSTTTAASAGPPTAQTADPNASSNTSADPKADPEATLATSLARIQVSTKRTLDLHEMWRSSLLKLSYLVLLLSLHQLNGCVGLCISDVKRMNANLLSAGVGVGGGGGGEALEQPVGGFEAVGLVVRDALPLLLGLAIAGLLVKFISLQDPANGAPADFGNKWYYVSAALVPMCLSMHFQLAQSSALSAFGDISGDEGDGGGAAVSTCVASHPLAARYFDPGTLTEIATRPKKQLPVVIVFHTIVTVSYWFMRKGREQCARNVELVKDLGRRYEEVRGRNEELKKKQAAGAKKGGGGGGSAKKKK